ncbi:hypothetical protein ACQKIK_14365, partial [Pseudomonas sp. NPDC047961]
CSKIEQKQLNTWVSFQSAEQPLLGQFSVSGNSVRCIPLLFMSFFFISSAVSGCRVFSSLVLLIQLSPMLFKYLSFYN